jgi:hypothetical protein
MDGKGRDAPSFLGLRTDKKATDVIREEPKPEPIPLVEAATSKGFHRGKILVRGLRALEELIDVGSFGANSPAWSPRS